MRALGPGPDNLRVEFSAPEQTPHRYARLELSLAEIRLYARTSEHTSAYLNAHGFTDHGDGQAVRSWPNSKEHARAAATATVVFLNHVDLDVCTETGDHTREPSTGRYTHKPRLLMTATGHPLPLATFDLSTSPESIRIPSE